MMMCKICNKESNDTFCIYHKLAYDKLKDNYEIWKKAYESITWEEYLMKVLKLEESGKWVKEVIRYQLEGLFKDD